MTRDELIEDITFAIASNFNEEPISVTKAVLAAIEAAGYAVVPKIPTIPMVNAGTLQVDGVNSIIPFDGGPTRHEAQSVTVQGEPLLQIYQAMLAASPLKQGEGA